MQLFGVSTRTITPGDDLVEVVLEALKRQGLEIRDGDLLAVASKVVAVAEGRLVRLSTVKPSERAKVLAERYGLEPDFAEVVLQEAEKVYGGVSRALLTLKNGVLVANAGVDRKNAPDGQAIPWPSNPNQSAENIRKEILARTGKRVGVLIIDSKVSPLRMGTTAQAIGVAGFKPIKDCRVEKDLYGKRIYITRQALADDLASAAHLLMGETTASTPVVIIRNAPIILSVECDPDSMKIPAEQCLFMQSF
jgi:coenzyme F420-0:L-glutamate ligase